MRAENVGKRCATRQDQSANRRQFVQVAETRFGRDPRAAQILIKSDPLVGRKHARLRQNGQGQYVIEDLTSHNGVIVNGVRISEPVTLQSEDRVVIGLTELLFVDQR